MSLFLDLDGTLVDLVERPQDVIADPALTRLLEALARRLGDRIAIISGRSIAQIDAILGPVAANLALYGSHGSELRWHGVNAHPIRPPELDEAAERLRAYAAGLVGMIVEDKSFGVALHYRAAPQWADEARALVSTLADELGFTVQPGKMMTELRLPGGNKGKAVNNLMARPALRGTTPYVLGDDETDEPAFEAALAHGGVGVLVGEPRPTAALYSLPGPAAVRQWLATLLT